MRILSRILIVCLCCLSYTHTVFAGNCYNITDLAAVERAKGFIKYGEAWNNLHYVLCGSDSRMCGEGDIVFDNNLRKLRRCSLNNGFETVNLSSIQSCNVDATERKLATYNKCGRVHCADYKIQAYEGKYIVYYKPNGTTTNALQQLCVADSTLYNKLKASCEGSGGTMFSTNILSCTCNTSGAREQFRCTKDAPTTVASPQSSAEFANANRSPAAQQSTSSSDTYVDYRFSEDMNFLERSAAFDEFGDNHYNCKLQTKRASNAATLVWANGQYLICGHQGTDGCNNNGVIYLEREKAFYKCDSSGLNKWKKLGKSEVSTHQGRQSNETYTVSTAARAPLALKVVDCYDSKCGIFKRNNETHAIVRFGFLDHTVVQDICETSGGTYNQSTGCACNSANGFKQNGWGACACQTGTYNSATKTCSSGSGGGGAGGGVSAGAGAGGAGTGAGAGGGSGNLSCTNLGQTEQAAGKGNTSYHICEVDGCSETRDCHNRDMLTAYATDGHCVSVGRQGYKICTATACEDNYEPYQGYCKKKDPAANYTGDPNTGDPNTGDPNTGDPNTGDPNTGDPNTGTPPSTITVSGFVKDKSNGEPLQMATLAYNETQGTTTDDAGKFEITDIAADTQISISFVGCTPVTKAASELVDATVELECATDISEVNVIRLECSHVGEQESTEQFQTRYKICEIDECSDKRDCVDDMLPSNAATGECVSAGRTGYKICTPATCVDGYTLNSETATCEPNAAQTNTNTTGINTTPTVDKVKEAEEAYKKAKENEQSLANRTLGAASTAATGLGLMNAAAAYSEQKADEAAEKDMTAYLETFRCEYGKGQTTKAGNEEITLPGGNDLLTYYTEYKQIADALKNTKKALGMRPGIEEEVVYDRAETGLYQYSSVGKTGGAYTSLANALTDPESEDAAAWNSQKDESKQKLKAGGIAAAGGVAGGVLGNTAINTDTFKNMFNNSEGE